MVEGNTSITTDTVASLVISVGTNFIVCVLAISNNVLLLITIVRTPKLHTLPNAYMVSLGAADLLVGLILIIRFFWLMPSTQWVFDDYKFVCLPLSCLLYTSEAASILSLVWLSLDRYLYIVWPYWYERNVTRRWVKWTISVSWLFCITFGSLPLVLNDFTPEKGCDGIVIISDAFFIALMVYFFLSAAIITFMYVQIFIVVAKQRRKILDETKCVTTQRLPKSRSQWKVLRFFLLVCVLFYICFLPLTLTCIFHLAKRDSKTAVNASVSIAAFNSALNFLVFLALRKDFRSALKVILCSNRKGVSPNLNTGTNANDNNDTLCRASTYDIPSVSESAVENLRRIVIQ